MHIKFLVLDLITLSTIKKFPLEFVDELYTGIRY